jgi:hypothetical protein
MSSNTFAEKVMTGTFLGLSRHFQGPGLFEGFASELAFDEPFLAFPGSLK